MDNDSNPPDSWQMGKIKNELNMDNNSWRAEEASHWGKEGGMLLLCT